MMIRVIEAGRYAFHKDNHLLLGGPYIDVPEVYELWDSISRAL